MFGKKMVAEMIGRSAANQPDRRNFLRAAGVGGLGVIGGAALLAQNPSRATAAGENHEIGDDAILNFALQLEYLEAQFYSFAAYGQGINGSLTGGRGTLGRVTGGAKVPFTSKRIRQYAEEIAGDELAHVRFLRSALGSSKTAQPDIDLKHSFTAAAQAAGLIRPGQSFDPFADEDSFLLGASLFEDVGVTAYKGAAPLISNATYLEAAAGILAVEAYHAGVVRSALFEKASRSRPTPSRTRGTASTGEVTSTRGSPSAVRPTWSRPTPTASPSAGRRARSSTSSTSTLDR